MLAAKRTDECDRIRVPTRDTESDQGDRHPTRTQRTILTNACDAEGVSKAGTGRPQDSCGAVGRTARSRTKRYKLGTPQCGVGSLLEPWGGSGGIRGGQERQAGARPTWETYKSCSD